jgi:hypothetical protein
MDNTKQKALQGSYVLLVGTRFVQVRYHEATLRVTCMGTLSQCWSVVSANVDCDILLRTRASRDISDALNYFSSSSADSSGPEQSGIQSIINLDRACFGLLGVI